MRILSLLLCILLSSCSGAFDEVDCYDTLVHIAVSGDGELFASVVRRDCWGTTAPSHSVYLRKSGAASDQAEKRGEKVYVLRGESAVKVAWRGARLMIWAPAIGKDVVFRRDEWEGVSIVYQWNGRDAAPRRDGPSPDGSHATG